jgi:hypothetical protein
MKKKNYLKLYEKWSKTGRLPQGLGLCNEFGKCKKGYGLTAISYLNYSWITK